MKKCPSCNLENKNSATFCTKCGSSFSRETRSSGGGGGFIDLFIMLMFLPFQLYAKAYRSYPRVTIGATILFVVYSLFLGYLENKKIEAEKVAITADANFPKDELAFTSLLKVAKDELDLADNDARKSLIKKNLKTDSLKILPRGLQITNWQGELISISTTTNGDVGFNIRLSGSQIYFSNFKGSTPHDVVDKILIKKDSKIFDIVAAIPSGTKVIFSGRLINTSNEYEKEFDNKYYNENFLFDLTDIKKN